MVASIFVSRLFTMIRYTVLNKGVILAAVDIEIKWVRYGASYLAKVATVGLNLCY